MSIIRGCWDERGPSDLFAFRPLLQPMRRKLPPFPCVDSGGKHRPRNETYFSLPHQIKTIQIFLSEVSFVPFFSIVLRCCFYKMYDIR